MFRRGLLHLYRASALVGLVGVALWVPTSAEAQQRRAVALSVLAVDANTGQPLEGVLIRLSGLGTRLVTGPDGTLDFEAPLGSYRLSARLPGYEILRGDFLVRRPGSFQVALEPMRFDEEGRAGRLIGTIVDDESGAPLGAAVVRIQGLGERLTDDAGRFVFEDLPDGASRIEVSRLGYEPREESIVVERGQTTSVSIGIAVAPIELDPISVEVRSRFLEDRGVYDRMEAGVAGRFLTREELANRISTHLGDSFRTMPGVQVQRAGDRTILLGRGGCALDIFVDGIPVMPEEADGLTNLDLIPPEWVEIAEVYPSAATAPVQFARFGSGCGVALIWTRQR